MNVNWAEATVELRTRMTWMRSKGIPVMRGFAAIKCSEMNYHWLIEFNNCLTSFFWFSKLLCDLADQIPHVQFTTGFLSALIASCISLIRRYWNATEVVQNNLETEFSRKKKNFQLRVQNQNRSYYSGLSNQTETTLWTDQNWKQLHVTIPKHGKCVSTSRLFWVHFLLAEEVVHLFLANHRVLKTAQEMTSDKKCYNISNCSYN